MFVSNLEPIGSSSQIEETKYNFFSEKGERPMH